jgi:hypothetical protein
MAWQIANVLVPGYGKGLGMVENDELQRYLDDGWEPFAVSETGIRGNHCIWIRRVQPVEDDES